MRKLKRRSLIIIACVLIVAFYNNIYPNFQEKETHVEDYQIQNDVVDDYLLQGDIVNTENEQHGNYDEVTVKRVVDGDTIIVNHNGVEERIRMLGIDCPESVNPDESKNTEEGKRASDYTKARLLENTILYLEYDKTKTDIYGRTLAYIWISDPTFLDIEDDTVIQNYMYNAELVSNGYATPKAYEPNTKYKVFFEKISK